MTWGSTRCEQCQNAGMPQMPNGIAWAGVGEIKPRRIAPFLAFLALLAVLALE
jgi:hypothetical protein